MIAILKKFWMDEEGGESVEWPLVIALVVIGLLGAWAGLREDITGLLTAIGDTLSGAESGPPAAGG